MDLMNRSWRRWITVMDTTDPAPDCLIQGIKDIDELEEPFIYSQGNTEDPAQTLEILSELLPDKSPVKNEEIRSST